jgi:hypothetical protein
MTGGNVTQRGAGANMSVDVQVGDYNIRHTDRAFSAWNDSVENVSISSADPSNPRRDIVVAYVDRAVKDTTNPNSPGALKFLAVAGTPAGSPSDPSDGTIQTAVGASNPYIKLARVAVAAGATSIVSANITDLRNPAALAVAYLYGGASNTKGHLVPNASDDTIALLNAVQTLANKTLSSPTIGNLSNAQHTHESSSGGGTLGPAAVPNVWWEELGRTTLGTAGDAITVSGFTARRYLRVLLFQTATGGTTRPALRFNGDATAAYAYRQSRDGGADATAGSTSLIDLTNATASFPLHAVIDVINVATTEKPVWAWSNIMNTAGAANVPGRMETNAKWANSANAITQVNIINNGGTGDFAVGSEVVILGHD